MTYSVLIDADTYYARYQPTYRARSVEGTKEEDAVVIVSLVFTPLNGPHPDREWEVPLSRVKALVAP